MPLLRGRVAGEARAALDDLSARFLHLRPSRLPGLGLGDGAAGLAVVHAALHRLFPKRGHRARAEEALDFAMARLSRRRLGPGLWSGVAGIGWVLSTLLEAPTEGDGPSAVIDAALADYLDTVPHGPFDLIEGLVGIGVYALERMPHAPNAGKRLLERIVDRLGETARRRRPGIAWWSDPRWVPPRYRENRPGDWNLGVAHGVPGVVAGLGLIVASEVSPSTRKKARGLLEGSVEWLLAQELPRSEEGCFGRGAGPGLREPARLAWCYGDPGIAATLLVAARAAGEPAWERAALRVGLRAAARSEATAGVRDAGLCHGAAGLAHLFHRLYRQTAEKRFASASRVWFGRALAMRVPGRGFAGFRAFDPEGTGRSRWPTDPTLLTGAAGIALALVAATTHAEPSWDRTLLLS
jgi:hypothetical protein